MDMNRKGSSTTDKSLFKTFATGAVVKFKH